MPIDSVIQLYCIFAGFLITNYIDCWERNVEISNYTEDFSFHFGQFLLQKFLSSVKCMYMSDFYVFMVNCSFYHYKLSFLSLIIFFALKSFFSVISIASIAFFLLMFAWYIFIHSFTFNIPILYLKWVSFRQHTVGHFKGPFSRLIKKNPFW